MSSPVIRVENLGKRYRIGIDKPPATSLGGRLRNALATPIALTLAPDERTLTQ